MYKRISKKLALFFLQNELINDKKAVIVCKGFATDDNDFVEVLKEDILSLEEDAEYKHFEVWLR
ncbi:MAG: hypothetical protein HPY53_10605 [Brevinematales bacterium]|nr:hypothetical protein [Brevinematales bacterium]